MNKFSERNISRVNKVGFTLVEVLLVVSLIAVIGAALYHTLSNGLKIWDRSQRFVIEEDILIFLDKIGQDVRNIFTYSQIGFEGKESYFAFPTTVRILADSKSDFTKGEYINQIGRVKYYFDKRKNRIGRKQANYSQALEGIFKENKVLCNSVTSLEFRYYYPGEGFLKEMTHQL